MICCSCQLLTSALPLADLTSLSFGFAKYGEIISLIAIERTAVAAVPKRKPLKVFCIREVFSCEAALANNSPSINAEMAVIIDERSLRLRSVISWMIGF